MSAFFIDDRLADGLLPVHVATCPECGGRVRLEIEETSDDRPTAGGCLFMCETDKGIAGASDHGYLGSDWIALEALWYQWAREHVTVAAMTAEEEAQRLASWETWAGGR